MAKKKSKGASKSGAVRDYLIQNPDATASTIIPELSQRGIDVSPALVTQVKTRMKRSGDLGGTAGVTGETAGKKTGGKKRAKKRARGTNVKKSATRVGTASNTLTADELLETKKLVDELGGIDRARRALQYLEDLG